MPCKYDIFVHCMTFSAQFMMTSSNGNIPRYWPFVRGNHRWPVNSPHKGQWRAALMFFWSSSWINGWVNNRAAGDLRRHRPHYDGIVMVLYYCPFVRWIERCQVDSPSKVSTMRKAHHTLPLLRFVPIVFIYPGPLLLTRMNFNPNMDRNYIHNEVWYEIAHPFPPLKFESG